MTSEKAEIEEIELDLLLEAISRRYGYDFKGYAKSSLKRRFIEVVERYGLSGHIELIDTILRDKSFFEKILCEITVNVTEMFRDASFYSQFRETIVPILRSYPTIKIWSAGCSTGEEPFSIAILLHEEGLLDRTKIYATDISHDAINKAKQGIFSIDLIKKYTQNYNKMGGKCEFSDYYHVNYDHGCIKNTIKEKIIFDCHNLVTDAPFSTVNLVLCRNVMIYFDSSLQTRVLTLLDNSLPTFGILCLGRKETLASTVLQERYKSLNLSERIYRKELEEGL